MATRCPASSVNRDMLRNAIVVLGAAGLVDGAVGHCCGTRGQAVEPVLAE